jgi:hypothetical protein
MAVLNFSCSVSQGFNFQKDEQILVGHINSLKISTTDFAKDLTVTDPTNLSGDKIKVVGVVSGITWNGGYSQPIQFSCQISTGNKNTATLMTHSTLSDTNVEFIFTIYDYDPIAKKYYKCFHTADTALKGLVEKSGGDLNMYIDQDQAGEVVSPKNFTFNLGVMPQELEQVTHVAVSDTSKFCKNWGVTVAA